MYAGDEFYGDDVTSPLAQPTAPNKPFVRVSAAEYDGPSRTDGISAPYAAMVAALGEPFKSTEPGYPDDDYKTDVCWCVRSTTRPRSIVTIWNYKNGPNYTHEGTIEDIDYFSVYQNDPELFSQVQQAIKQQAYAIRNEAR